jgi:hypothetical protein
MPPRFIHPSIIYNPESVPPNYAQAENDPKRLG